MKHLIFSFLFLLEIHTFSLGPPKSFLQISNDFNELTASSEFKKKSLDEDYNLDSYDSNSKVSDPLNDLKDFNGNDFNFKDTSSDHHKSLKSKAYEDLDEKFNKKFAELEEKSSDFFSLKPKTDLNDDISDESLAPKRSKRNKFIEEEQDSERIKKPMKFSDENLDEILKEDKEIKPLEIHHSQAYRKHLEQLKKLKSAEAVESPSEKDPILGSFVKNLQNIASGDNNTFLESSPNMHFPSITPYNSIREHLSQNYIDADKSLIKNLMNKNVFNSLPGEVRNLIKFFQNQYKINETVTEIEPSKFITKYFESNNVSLMPSSQPFVDTQGKIGRRGFFALINTTSLNSESVWVILNGKVFCIYNSEDYVSIYHLFRNSALRFHDMIGTPCFIVFLEQEKSQREMLCAASILEKEIWLQAILAANHQSASVL